MGVLLAKHKSRRGSVKRKRGARRISYLEKVQRKDFQNFNVDDLAEFFADCYEITNGMKWLPENRQLVNMVFGRIRDWCDGPVGALNYIMASFQHRIPPRSVTWYNGPYCREMHEQDYFDHCLRSASDLRKQWNEMTEKLIDEIMPEEEDGYVA